MIKKCYNTNGNADFYEVNSKDEAWQLVEKLIKDSGKKYDFELDGKASERTGYNVYLNSGQSRINDLNSHFELSLDFSEKEINIWIIKETPAKDYNLLADRMIDVVSREISFVKNYEHLFMNEDVACGIPQGLKTAMFKLFQEIRELEQDDNYLDAKWEEFKKTLSCHVAMKYV